MSLPGSLLSRLSTRVVKTPSTYDITITFISASGLPAGDAISSDPYVLATLSTRFSESDEDNNPPLQFRTKTERNTLDPRWNHKWHIRNVPQLGSRLYIKVMDEDPGSRRDDQLGNAVIELGDLNNWSNGEMEYKLHKRGATMRVNMLDCMRMSKRNARVAVAIEVRGETKLVGEDVGRAFTVGPHYWTKHYSPLIGIITGAREPEDSKSGAHRFMFEANKIQLIGPPPKSLKHEYVRCSLFISYFTKKGLKGRLLNRVLHDQYNTIYSYDRKTQYGCVDSLDEPNSTLTTNGIEHSVEISPSNGASSIPQWKGSRALAKQFLKMVHYDEGARIFTYVLTLDAEWRFTETGTEFAINMLSKHSMHSNVSQVIAYSGEFFVRRKQKPGVAYHHGHGDKRVTLTPSHLGDMLARLGPSVSAGSGSSCGESMKRNSNPGLNDFFHGNIMLHNPDGTCDPEDYELVIDNESGTYWPKKEYLDDLKRFLEANLVGLKVVVYDWTNEEIKRLKNAQRMRKARERGERRYKQPSSIGSDSDGDALSLSSSDLESLRRGQNSGIGGVLEKVMDRILDRGPMEPEENTEEKTTEKNGKRGV